MYSFYKMIYICHLIHTLELDSTSHSSIQYAPTRCGRPKQLSSMERLVDYSCGR